MSAIERGTLKHGQKLPSLRDMMRTHQVSLSTVVQACRWLETQGWLEARARYGYFVRGRNPSASAAIQETTRFTAVDEPLPHDSHSTIAEVLALGQRHAVTVNFAVASCAPELYPAEELRKLTVHVLRSNPNILTSPASSQGNLVLKSSLAKRALMRGIQVAPDDVIVTHGCSEALALALRAVTKPGDAVIVESPTYYGFLQLFETLGLKPIELPTNPRTGLVVDAVEFALSGDERVTAIVAMPSLHNPLGSAMPNDQKERLVRLCESHDVALIEDDICGDLVPDNLATKAAKSWDKSGQVIYCNSLNKTLSPGLRLGWLLAGKWHAKIETMTMAQSRPKEDLPQRVAGQFIAGGGFDRHLRRLRAHLQTQRIETVTQVSATFPADTRVALPDAGMLLWVELPRGVSAMHLYRLALRDGIKIVPGAIFSASRRVDSFMRLSCGWPLTKARADALARLGELTHELASA